MNDTTTGTDSARDAAIKRLHAKRNFASHIVSYIVISLFMVAIWWFSGRGYFWPVYVILGLGIGLAIEAWNVFARKPITDADVEREMRRSA